ncbi:hypothetical protein GCM10009593_29260 [Microlunatus antarcticus]
MSTGAPADFVRLSVDVVAVEVEVVETSDVTGVPAGVRPVAVAELFTAPASTSAWVITYGAVVVHVVVAPGASVVAGQPVAPTFASPIATPAIVWTPSLDTRKLYETRSPASTRPLLLTSTGLLAVLVRLSAAAVLVAVVVESVLEVTRVPSGRAALALAVLVTAPASTWAWVIVAVPVQVPVAPGASVVAVQVALTRLSSTVSRSRVTAPVFRAVNV